MRRALSPAPIAIVCVLLALIALLAYGLARTSLTAASRRRSRAASASRRRPSSCRARRRRRATRSPTTAARWWCSTSGPRGASPAGPSRRCSSAGTGELGDGRGTVLGVDVLDVTGDAQDFIARVRPHLSDAAGQATATGSTSSACVAYPETFVIDRAGRIAAVRRGPVDDEFMRENVAPLWGAHEARASPRWRSSRSPSCRPRRRRGLPQDHPRRHGGRGDVPRLRHAARRSPPRPRRPSASAPSSSAWSTTAARRTRSSSALVAEFGDNVLALPGDEGTTTSATCSCTSIPGARHPARRRRDRDRGRALAAGARGGRPAAPARRRRRRAARRRPGAVRPVIAARSRRHHGRRRLRGGLHLVHLALRAAARARLPLHHLRRLVRRHPGGRGPRARCSAPRCCSASPSR